MTLRELDWMADEHERAEWKRQAELMALIANVNRPEGKPAYYGSDFNLSIERQKRKAQKASINFLKCFLNDEQRAAANGGT